jgi:hypothetical protein
MRFEQLEARLALSASFDFRVVAETGAATSFNLLELSTHPSINDNGYVAFTAESENNDGQPADNIYAFNPTTGVLHQLMNPVFMYTNVGVDASAGGTGSFFGEVQINNANQVLARRRLNAVVQVGVPFGTVTTAPLTYLETWSADAANPPGLPIAQVAMGLPAGSTAPLWFFLNPETGNTWPSSLNLASPYEGLFSTSTINNFGQVNFSGIVRGVGNNRISSNTTGDLVSRGGIANLTIHPMLADNGYYAFSTSDNRVFAERWDGAGLQVLANSAGGFSSVGEAGISDDGRVIAFAGLGPTGPGIFVSPFNAQLGIYEAPYKIAGVGRDGRLEPSERWDDVDFDGVMDDDEDIGPFAGFGLTRVSVNKAVYGGVDSYEVVFLAGDDPGDPTQQGLYRIRFDGSQLVKYASRPELVVAVGERIPGLASPVTGISVHDALNAVGDLAFHVTTQAGGQAIVKATQADSDGDSLYDHWELDGIDYDGDGTADLTLTDADPLVPDLYVEIDALNGHGPLPPNSSVAGLPAYLTTNTSLDPVVASFFSNGVRLHLEIDETNLSGGPWGQAAANLPSEFYQLKETSFGTSSQHGNTASIEAKKLAFRYAIFAHSFEVVTCHKGATILGRPSGKAESGGNDFVVTVGTVPNLTPEWQAGTFMHELGHTLGLGHGGGDHENYKPNYRSVMSYLWQTPAPLPGPGNQITPGWMSFHNAWRLDYSHGTRSSLNETALDESAGLGGDPTVYVPVGLANGKRKLMPEGGPIDLNSNNTTTDTGIAVDLNTKDPLCSSSGFATLEDHDDWGSLEYGFRDSLGFLDGNEQTPGDDVFLVDLDWQLLIESLESSDPLRGDFNGDNRVDAQDIDLLFDAISNGTIESQFDLTIDGDVDEEDVRELVEVIIGTQFGDADLNRQVNRRDAATLGQNFGRNDRLSWADGNFDGDRIVGLVDLAILQSNYLNDPLPSAPAPSLALFTPRPSIPALPRGRVSRTQGSEAIARERSEPTPSALQSPLRATRHPRLAARSVDRIVADWNRSRSR